ncbi:MAG TPA: histidine phosphatase family protein [Burkholderiales bacterium]|jgi:phosphohistidine phosphatase SixA|nr:histidine phosphatase family protein [Burkholderiales bacterium]
MTGGARVASPVTRFLTALLLLAGFSTGTVAAPAGVPEQEQALSGEALVAALKRGGYVIYFRHADTGPAYSEQGVDLKRCETQRNLNDNGREEATLIGAQFRALKIPVGEVLASEFCRCVETANIAFGRHTIEPLLTGVGRSAEAAPRRERAIAALKNMLGATPAAGKNTVLVSHGYNLWDAEGFHLGTQGEAAVYKPDGKGGYALVARVLPREWAELR